MKDFEIRRPSEDYAVHFKMAQDAGSPALAIRTGDRVTIVPLDRLLPNNSGKTVRAALLEALFQGCQVESRTFTSSAPASATGAAMPGEAREILFEHDADGNIIRAIDQRAR